ncbi:MAG: hypothetical protein K6A94_00980 [Bacteroidales bacterium]|nr:hypothetical protein [Bacteroidales bacterium]
MLNEWATYEELIGPYKEAREYGHNGYNNPRIIREFRHGKKEVWYRTRTPKSKHLVQYYYTNGTEINTLFGRNPKDFMHLGFLVLEGVHDDNPCESFCASCFDNELLVVIRGHAIYRYIDRHHFKGTLEQAQRKILSGIALFDVKNDTTTAYVYYDGGVFLCSYVNHVLVLGTYVMNSRLYPVQRMKSLQSELSVMEAKKEIGIL